MDKFSHPSNTLNTTNTQTLIQNSDQKLTTVSSQMKQGLELLKSGFLKNQPMLMQVIDAKVLTAERDALNSLFFDKNLHKLTLQSPETTLQVLSKIAYAQGTKLWIRQQSPTVFQVQHTDVLAKHLQAQVIRQFSSHKEPGQTFLPSLILHPALLAKLLPSSEHQQIQAILSLLAANVLDSKKISSTKIKTIIENAGQLLEAKLAQGQGLDKNAVIQDTKGQLLTLLDKLNGIIKSLSDTQTSSRKTTKQLASLEAIKTLFIFLNQFHSGKIINSNKQGTLSSLDTLIEHLFKPESRIPLYSSLDPQKSELFLKQVIKDIEKKLLKITTNQLMVLAQSGSKTDHSFRLHSIIEIPITFGHFIETVSLQIEEQATNKTAARSNEKIWRVSLSFNFEQYGIVKARCLYTSGELSLNLFAESEITHKIVKEHLSTLKSSFNQTAITLKECACHKGLPKEQRKLNENFMVNIKL